MGGGGAHRTDVLDAERASTREEESCAAVGVPCLVDEGQPVPGMRLIGRCARGDVPQGVAHVGLVL
eukprot:scaffold2188_cov102-Isochrysis_galbana.AAC.17